MKYHAIQRTQRRFKSIRTTHQRATGTHRGRRGINTDADIRLDADAASAPESCGSFFWDPLIYSVPGDGMAASVAASSAPTSQAPDVASRGLLPGLVMTALSFSLVICMGRSQPRDQPCKMGVNKSAADSIDVPKFKEGKYTFPDSVATLQLQRRRRRAVLRRLPYERAVLQRRRLHLNDPSIFKAGKTTGKEIINDG